MATAFATRFDNHAASPASTASASSVELKKHTCTQAQQAPNPKQCKISHGTLILSSSLASTCGIARIITPSPVSADASQP
jgi:hypothetical protein